MRRLYEPHAHPLTRIVHGQPVSWEPNIAATKFPSPVEAAVWSPCSRFVAIAWGKSTATIEILDAATLERLTTLEQPGGTRWLVFSPESHVLMCFGVDSGTFTSWDPQTGTLISTITTPPDRSTRPADCLSVAYSPCGTMFGVLFLNDHTSTICTYNVLSNTRISSCSVEGRALDRIWTHGELLRFAAIESELITIWEVGFASTDAPTRVESLPLPSDSDRSTYFLFHPTHSRIAFIAGGRVKVWSAQDSKFLLDSADVKWPRRMSFSLDGRFFACGTDGAEFYLWKETPTGYTLYQKLTSNTGAPEPLVSPNGESIITFGGSRIQLWRTTDLTAPSSGIPARASQGSEGFVLGFSPDGALAVFTRTEDETVTVLDLKFGIPLVTIDTGMKVYGLRVGESTIVVVGEGRIVVWNLPAGDRVPGSRINVNDSVQTATFDHPLFPTSAPRPTISVSLDLRCVAIMEGYGDSDSNLHIYDIPTKRRLGSMSVGSDTSPWFPPVGHGVWCIADNGEAELQKIDDDKESDVTKLECLASIDLLPHGFPWRPSRDYSVTDGGWVVRSSGKQLLWLPPRWRSEGWNRMWSGRFLVLLYCELAEPVILELEE